MHMGSRHSFREDPFWCHLRCDIHRIDADEGTGIFDAVLPFGFWGHGARRQPVVRLPWDER